METVLSSVTPPCSPRARPAVLLDTLTSSPGPTRKRDRPDTECASPSAHHATPPRQRARVSGRSPPPAPVKARLEVRPRGQGMAASVKLPFDDDKGFGLGDTVDGDTADGDTVDVDAVLVEPAPSPVSSRPSSLLNGGLAEVDTSLDIDREADDLSRWRLQPCPMCYKHRTLFPVCDEHGHATCLWCIHACLESTRRRMRGDNPNVVFDQDTRYPTVYGCCSETIADKVARIHATMKKSSEAMMSLPGVEEQISVGKEYDTTHAPWHLKCQQVRLHLQATRCCHPLKLKLAEAFAGVEQSRRATSHQSKCTFQFWCHRCHVSMAQSKCPIHGDETPNVPLDQVRPLMNVSFWPETHADMLSQCWKAALSNPWNAFTLTLFARWQAYRQVSAVELVRLTRELGLPECGDPTTPTFCEYAWVYWKRWPEVVPHDMAEVLKQVLKITRQQCQTMKSHSTTSVRSPHIPTRKRMLSFTEVIPARPLTPSTVDDQCADVEIGNILSSM